ncbi:MAG: DNA mismatch repair protein MutS, partial [Cytophagales bacterium]|nr:DNA mismatch repair protein MutS [Cytophagales bacterium]
MSEKAVSETPLMKQYMAIKAKYPGALLLFRVGDFYETFGEDAVTASKILGIVLTKRANGSASHVELAGFPHHSLDTYMPKLVRAGYRVAICDQLEDPKMVKGIVKRGVTELVTPGLTMNDNVLDVRRNNYLASVYFTDIILGIALLDISTGEFYTAQGSKDYVEKVIQSFSPSEIVFPKSKRKEFESLFGDKFNTYALDEWIFAYDYAFETLTRHFKTTGLKGFGIEGLPEGTIAAGAILHYLHETEHKDISHITAVARIEEERYVWLDKFTIRNLELVSTGFEGGVSLISILDKTTTPMGSRMLKNWLLLPLKEITPIKERQDVVEKLVQQEELLEMMISELKPVGDLERLISKVAARRVTPRELQQLYRSLSHIGPIKNILEKQPNESFKKMAGQLNTCDFILEKIGKELKEDPPVNIALGNVIQDGVDEELDQLRKIAFSGKEYLADIQYRESQRTGIASLKISFNKVFGYYIEVSNANKDKVPNEWIRKQTLANGERYITEELKIYEEKILTAEEKISSIEIRLFTELVHSVADFVRPIQLNARVVAQLDCLCSFARAARDFNYVRPEVNDSLVLDIHAGRHPVIERQLPLGEPYIPNDVLLDVENQQIIIITGPNMAGKSALLRQTALIVLLAQIGSFVPAQAASIGLVDKIFTRVGASDNLSKGESTFMVEMTETA